AAGAELGGLFAHERFKKSAAVRLRIDFDHEVVQRAHHRVFAGGEVVQLGGFEDEGALTHGALHVDDAVAHHAAQAGLHGRGGVLNLANGRVEHPAEEQSGIVAAGAPFGSFYTSNVLHVFDAFAVPLIVEGREVVGRAVPLPVYVAVAALAGLRLHEVFCGDV